MERLETGDWRLERIHGLADARIESLNPSIPGQQSTSAPPTASSIH